MAGNTSVPGATVASRLLALLRAFDGNHHRLTLTELARRAELPVPTAHRLIAELVAGGALDRDDGGYRLGRLLWEVGLHAQIHGRLRRIAEPYLYDAYAATMATVHLAVRDGDQALYLLAVRGPASTPVVSSVGSRLPLHATGVGKVLLAHSPDALRERLAAGLIRVTAHTITHAPVLAAQLERIRCDGMATTAEEMTLGACSLAVPVFRASDGSVAAAIGVVVGTLRHDRQRMLAALHTAACGVGRRL
jgi:DNA-binding IclR family transcriptional regulator